jgi:membrane-associated protein
MDIFNHIFNHIFTLILIYGYPAIALAVFASSAGVPLPGVAIVLVTGSLAASGNQNMLLLFALVTACSVAGDLVDYFLGKKIGNVLIDHVTKRSEFSKKSVLKAQKFFAEWSGMSVFLTRWLLPPLGPTVSVIAGITDYPLRRFVFFDITGQMISSILFLGLGYAFSVNWPTIWSFLNGAAGIGVGLIVGLTLIVVGLRRIWKKR